MESKALKEEEKETKIKNEREQGKSKTLKEQEGVGSQKD